MDYAASLLNYLPKSRRGTRFKNLLGKLGYLAPSQLDIIVDAYEFGSQAHEGQRRYSGELYITHPVAVAEILADLHLDYQSITAALMHDVIEDTPTAKEQIADRFGQEIAGIVDGVSKLDQLSFDSRAEAQAESFRKMMLAMVEDIRVILLKLADRLHNMQTLGALPMDKQQRIARETLDIYAPIANRLGVYNIKTSLETLGFQYAFPYRYRVLDKAVNKSRGNQRHIVGKISDRLSKTLDETGITNQVHGRQKNLYSIYRKMLEKRRSLNEITDVFGFRIIVESSDDCYRALGVSHTLYKPVPGRFKDFIAIPRLNGYESLHTTLLGPNGIPIEVQIRTEEMNRVAESGIAAHWQYKAMDKKIIPPQIRAREWLKSITEMQSAANSEEFMEHVKVDLFPDNVYVFTPKGTIMRLPRGSTCVDFAYAVHTDVGNRCVAAKIDRRLVPLQTHIKNGTTVEIITAKSANPDPRWVSFVVTAKARYSVRQYLKNLQHGEARDLGRRLLNQALRDAGSSLRKISRNRMRSILDELGMSDTDELFKKVGLGERHAPLVSKILLENPSTDSSGTTISSPLTIAGTENLIISYARCCHPIPGDAIMGYLSTGRGIIVHRTVCGNLSEFRKQPDKWVAVNWEETIEHEFSAEITTEILNQPGALAEIAARIGDTGSNIEQVSINDRQEKEYADLTFLILVRDRIHLARVIRRIRSMQVVKKISRSCA
ncbi:MAG: bifunctional (p)ppGpp synthetase/guanosine-3',5'-bis(diphosphate) 3'-pyrophosphohydrolase [Gammaproteobacteria bacterium]|jgi:GTP pyrophosphokinase|nr:bifunctional GTP diphosphokinase/guanosine-3',5'-bis(diphosphate) 3'-diphosphatase [Chromatiales bacterium]MCP4925149.1 bifunctional (p)ppGpp synthetase/guanosine-3',5'-bis(diphosphate) 3'-pyrophosphohydrolase [Gammaproteobacteria bacterium]MDP7152987.1 bifunctional (p)ppGpp synthetase/guanosine-3',5'-bis(diphosphate) 3'-pyrophosphohydrolase [Gammaproteobacteria bacterium]